MIELGEAKSLLLIPKLHISSSLQANVEYAIVNIFIITGLVHQDIGKDMEIYGDS